MGVILITHDLGLAASFCEDMHVMYARPDRRKRGCCRCARHARLIPYSEALLESICTLDRDVDRPIAAISGQPPLPRPAAEPAALPPALRVRAGGLRRHRAPPVPVDGRVTECHFPLVQEQRDRR